MNEESGEFRVKEPTLKGFLDVEVEMNQINQQLNFSMVSAETAPTDEFVSETTTSPTTTTNNDVVVNGHQSETSDTVPLVLNNEIDNGECLDQTEIIL